MKVFATADKAFRHQLALFKERGILSGVTRHGDGWILLFDPMYELDDSEDEAEYVD